MKKKAKKIDDFMYFEENVIFEMITLFIAFCKNNGKISKTCYWWLH